MKKFEHEVIFCIVNAGFSEAVMDAARQFGARGGTVLRARGTANPESELLFGISVQPEKEMVMILVSAVPHLQHLVPITPDSKTTKRQRITNIRIVLLHILIFAPVI